MDFTGLAEVQDAIRELGIEVEEEKDVFKALGGLLHLGQVLSCTSSVTLGMPLTIFSGPFIQLTDVNQRLTESVLDQHKRFKVCMSVSCAVELIA